MTLFVAGIAACLLTQWVGFHIIRIVETRLNEEKQWRTVTSAPSPSETYWSERIESLPQETSEVEEWVRLRPASPPDMSI